MARYTVTVSSFNGRKFRVFNVNNHGQAIGIVRMLLTMWGGIADIMGRNPKDEFVQEYFICRNGKLLTANIGAYRTLWNMIWKTTEEEEEPKEERTVMTYNIYNIHVEQSPKKGLVKRAVEWFKRLF